jgi:tight adherence protein C
MSDTVLIVAGGGFSLLMVVSSLWMMSQSKRQERFRMRVAMIHGQAGGEKKSAASQELRQALIHFANMVGTMILRSGLVPAKTLSELEATLAASGMRGSQGIGIFIGAKLMLLIVLPLITWLVSGNLPLPAMLLHLLPMVAALIGLVLPDKVIGGMRKAYVKKLEAGVPDTLDMLVICTQAGLGMGPAILRVAAELRMAYPEAAEELETTATEMQLLADSRVAISQLGTRTGLESLKRLAATMMQSLQYGTPLSEALRVLSTELRQGMLNRCESRAAKLPVMMTLPTIAFILPCVFLVAGGPAIIQLVHAFSH